MYLALNARAFEIGSLLPNTVYGTVGTWLAARASRYQVERNYLARGNSREAGRLGSITVPIYLT